MYTIQIAKISHINSHHYQAFDLKNYEKLIMIDF